MIERLNRTYKASYHHTNWFDNIDDANYDLALWVAYYNFLRPHKHAGYKVLNEVEMLQGADNMPRACLKNHSRNLHAPVCGIFCPNSVAVARYGAFIRTKSPTNCDAHLAESLFQTRSSKWQLLIFLGQQTILNIQKNGTAASERNCCQ